MKNIFVGGAGTCGVHNERYMIDLVISKSFEYGITDDFREADLIVIIDTCMATDDNTLESFNYLKKVLKEKRYDAEVVVSGCLVKGIKFKYSQEYIDILKQVICVDSDRIIEYVTGKIKPNLNKEILDRLDVPYTIEDNKIYISPVSGCLNNCSFCKSNYMNFSLNSIPYEKIERFSKWLDGYRTYLNYIDISSSNLSLYGVDLYGEQRSHEVIKILTSSESIKFANIGALINFYPELIDEILNNSKIKSIFTSIESGSDRIYNLMNRPISLDKLKEIIRLIRKERPDIIINTEFISGYPTETKDDLKKTIDLVYELDINPIFIHPYKNSQCIPSAKLPQYSFDYCVKKARYLDNKVKKLRDKFSKVIVDGEMLVLDKNEEYRVYLCMLTDGSLKEVGFDHVDREYNINEIISGNKIIHKRLSRGYRNMY